MICCRLVGTRMPSQVGWKKSPNGYAAKGEGGRRITEAWGIWASFGAEVRFRGLGFWQCALPYRASWRHRGGNIGRPWLATTNLLTPLGNTPKVWHRFVCDLIWILSINYMPHPELSTSHPQACLYLAAFSCAICVAFSCLISVVIYLLSFINGHCCE